MAAGFASAATYGLGVFNDSIFRQSAMLIALTPGESLEHMQGRIMLIFTLPYILFAWVAGWLADRFPKRRVVIGAKALELLAMTFGAVGIWSGNWWFLIPTAFVMGLQSCLFSPALNGSIPELYPSVYVTKANARLKVVTTVAILGGVVAALDPRSGRILALEAERLEADEKAQSDKQAHTGSGSW